MPPNSPFNLKQKLASLSLSQSSLSSPNGVERGSPTMRKMLFNPPWKRQAPSPYDAQAQGQSPGLVQDVLPRMIFQAGVDYECVESRSSLVRDTN